MKSVIYMWFNWRDQCSSSNRRLPLSFRHRVRHRHRCSCRSLLRNAGDRGRLWRRWSPFCSGCRKPFLGHRVNAPCASAHFLAPCLFGVEMMSTARATELNLVLVKEQHDFRGNDAAPHHLVTVIIGHPDFIHEFGVVPHGTEQDTSMIERPHMGFPSI